MEERTKTNYDHPDSLETDLLVQHIRDLKAGKTVEVPMYDFADHTRMPASKSVQLAGPRPILIIEGILILCHPGLIEEMDLKVFVEAAPDIRFIRRMERDCAERGRTMAQVIEQYHRTVRPMHEQYVEPSKYVADLIVHSSNETPHTLDVPCNVLKNHLRVITGEKWKEDTPDAVENAEHA
jgi:uridine kinase